MGLAWLEWNGVLYWSEHRRVAFEPRSAVSSLVEGIWRRAAGSAHFILRSRIFTDTPLTELCRGTIMICAKRCTRVSHVPTEIAERMEHHIRAVQVWPEHRFSSRSLSFLPPAFEGTERAQQNRAIECWLISDNGRLLATAANSAGRNRIRHAEMNLLAQWWLREGRPLPRGGRLIVTREPCAMCAGAIWECVDSKSDFEVRYLEPETGSSALRSVLKGHPMLRHCRSFSHPVKD
jgi:hypothetical protein